MASGQTMSTPTDWLSQSYHTDFFNAPQSDTPPPPVVASASAASPRNTNNHLSPDQGRVAKPLRRRSRASRRTPTTLLNTDTSNFRAMVQRFTGGPAAAAFAAAPQVPIPRAGTLNFMDHMAGGGAGPPGRGFHVQYANHELQQQQQQHMMFMMGGRGGGAAAQPPRAASGNENRSYENYLL